MAYAGWTIIAHVIPEEDLCDHTTLPDCICGPNAEHIDGGTVYTHHALDGREAMERRDAMMLTGGLTG